ncbi:uncharacterized protein LOC117628898 [Prunus dulcis]|uniref:uncharacterized protein LOC117628898 n=1 Tax=Prunus dulcis TaxID=3755 RepID=UPI001482E429|nr:uncharacterized protein LOC117628898 [Prunus dulcis]
MDDQSNLMRQLLNQISLAQNLGLGQPGQERRMDELVGRQLEGYQAGRARVSREGEGQQSDRPTDMWQASASHTQSRLSLRNNILAEIYEIAELYELWDDDQIAAKKSTNQEDQPTKQAGQRSDGFSNKIKDERRSHPQENTTAGENYTKFTIPIHQILVHGKNKPWVRRPPPLKGDPNKKDVSKYCAFHGMHGHTMNNCFARKTHVEELVREGHCTKFIAKQAIQWIEDRDTTKEPPQKVIRINIILADYKECGLTRKKRKRKIKQATVISQMLIDLPPVKDDHVIGFPKKYLIGLDMPYNDALVISIQIAQAMVDRIHADEGSAANILQLAVIQQMGLEAKINKSARSQTFMVINEVSPYNGILDRPWIGKINAITSATHQKIRYPIPGGGVSQINTDQAMARKCSAQGLKKSTQVQFLLVSQTDLKEVEQPNLAPL